MWINLGLLIVGAVYTYAAWGQWKVTEGALRETKRSVDFAVQTERPWIIVTPPDPPLQKWMKIKEGNIPPTILIWTATNIGRSPAFVTRLQIRIKVMDFPPPAKVPLYEVFSPFSKFPIPPNGTYKGQIPDAIPQSEIEGLLARKRCIAFFGFIGYEDSGGQEHQTRFFSYWEYIGVGWRISDVGPDGTIEYT